MLSGSRAFTHDQSVEPFAQRCIVLRCHFSFFKLPYCLNGLLQACVVAWVGRKQPMVAPAAARNATVEVFLIFQNRDNIDHRGGFIPCLEQIFGTQTVRLQLHIPAKTTQAGLRPNRGHLADLRPGVTTPGGHRGNEAANLSSDVGKPAPGLLLNCMSGRDVTNLVGNNGSKLGFSIDESQQPAIDVNVTTRQRHRIDGRTVDNRISVF